jgi:hypothetical protein
MMYFCSGPPMQFLSGVDTQQRSPLQGSPLMTFPQPVRTKEQECADLAHRLADLNPINPFENGAIDQIASALTALGCGCGTEKK